MSEKIIVGPINQGIRTDRTAFVIDNDSFPKLENAYQWRGRIRRKRGTSFLGRLNRYIGSTDGSGNLTVTISPAPIASGISQFVIGSDIFVDPGGASPVTLLTNSSGSATLNRSSGVLTVTGSQVSTSVYYYPGLPVMGIRQTLLNPNNFPGNIAFDTDYSYNILNTSPYTIYDISYYKNPTTNTYTNYTQKSTWTPTTWNGQNYQQFWTVNYQGALWATNGITVPFDPTNVGMQFLSSSQISSATQTSATTVDFVIPSTPLVVGDFVFANEFTGTSGPSLNFQTGYVNAINSGTNTYTVKFPNATIGGAGLTPGILQYLTNRSSTTKDCIRYYNGPPVSSANPPAFLLDAGWVNFMPPLSQNTFSIADRPALQYYLVGARMIVPFKDRLLFLGPVIQASSGTPIYLQDTVIFSQNGTPYYTCSYTSATNNPSSPTNNFNAILVPSGQTATASAWFEDQSGFGGYISAGIAQPLTTVSSNEDVLIMGFTGIQTRFIYTGNDLLPFNFFVINSELGASSTFSAVNLDRGVIAVGQNGIVLTAQDSAQRIDLQIPDNVFQFNLTNNGTERICSQRDFISEWIYFTYLSDEVTYTFPNQTLQYNYRDSSWAIFNECYTTYGTFRKQTGYTWATIGNQYATWSVWNDPWSSGTSTLEQPQVAGGNQQGFILLRDEGTNEGNSLSIQNIDGTTVTSPNHCLNNGDYIVISGCIGTIATNVNGKIFRVNNPTTNTFTLNPTVATGTYFGGGVIKRMYVPKIMTKQFPVSWQYARKTRIGAQQYLFTRTPAGQLELQIFLSQNDENPYNSDTVVPNLSSNNSLIYTDTIYTSPQYPINYSNNVSLGNVGDGVLTTITLNLFNIFSFSNQIIAGSVYFNIGSGTATFQDDGSGGFTVTGTGVVFGSSINYTTGVAVLVFTVAPNALPSTVTLSYYYTDIQTPTAGQQQQIWHRMNTSLLGDTVQIGFTMSDAQMRDTNFSNQFVEIELHAFVISVSPSQLLA